jgi:putative endonuclease
MNNRKIGKENEEIASKFLTNQGLKIINKNYFTKFGEIDLIGIENKTIIFIEVKFRSNENFGKPFESVNIWKQEKIRNAADYYLSENDFSDFDCRFDVVSLTPSQNNFKIEWLKNQYFC